MAAAEIIKNSYVFIQLFFHCFSGSDNSSDTDDEVITNNLSRQPYDDLAQRDALLLSRCVRCMYFYYASAFRPSRQYSCDLLGKFKNV